MTRKTIWPPIPRRHRAYRHPTIATEPARKTIQALAGGVVHLRRTPEGATLTVIQDGYTTAIVTLDAAGLIALAEHADSAAEALEPGGTRG